MKNPKTKYDRELAVPGIRRYILEHVQRLDRMLADIERAESVISGPKSQFCMAGLNIVGYVCDLVGRYPATAKIIKILEWDEWDVDLISARTFIGVCTFYRIWVKRFADIAAPIYLVFKKKRVQMGRTAETGYD